MMDDYTPEQKEENELKEKYSYLFESKCLSKYVTDFIPGNEGCLFALGGKLYIYNSFWRKADNEIYPHLHVYEEKMSETAGFLISDGIPALIFIYCIINHDNGMSKKALDKDFLRFLYYQINEHIDYLIEWLDVLNIFNGGTDNIKEFENINIQMRCLLSRVSDYIQACYYRAAGFVTLNEAERMTISSRAKVKNHNELLFITPVIPTEDSLIQYNEANMLPYAHINLEDFDIWMHIAPDGYCCMNLVGFSAYICAKAFVQNKRRVLSYDEYLENEYLSDNETDEQEKGVYEDFCSFELVHSIYETADQEEEIDEESVGVVRLELILFTLDIPKSTLFENYLNLITPLWKNLMSKLPNFPIALVQDEKLFYSFVLLAERNMLTYSEQSDIWQTLVPEQQSIIRNYVTSFMSYLRHDKHADEALINQFLEEESLSIFDMIPDIQITSPKTNAEKSQTFNWPYYAKDAEEKDKLFFEQQLCKLCISKKRSATKDVRNYLKLKVDEKLITRPSILKDEWEILKKFGYNKTCKAYYNSN